jgi:four helix bundle protein
MQRFTDLNVWRRAHELALAVYRLTRTFPADERFELTSQLRRAASSIPTNIAEGSKRRTSADYAKFLNIAEGSAGEVEYLLILARDLGYASPDSVATLLGEAIGVQRMLYSLRAKVEAGAKKERAPEPSTTDH